jgi:ferredoxin
MCAELLPERIVLDDWGYPMIDPQVPASLHEHAERAVKACPALALRLRQARAARRG